MMINLDAGILDKRIQIQERQETPDGEGGFTVEWVTVRTVWAQVKSLGAKRIFEYRSQNVDASHQIKVRGNVPVEENNKILFRNREFEILTIEDELEESVTKWITCLEQRD